jgi:hypothetical protein
MATYLAQNPENTPILSAENWRNLHNFILCMCAKSSHPCGAATALRMSISSAEESHCQLFVRALQNRFSAALPTALWYLLAAAR